VLPCCRVRSGLLALPTRRSSDLAAAAHQDRADLLVPLLERVARCCLPPGTGLCSATTFLPLVRVERHIAVQLTYRAGIWWREVRDLVAGGRGPSTGLSGRGTHSSAQGCAVSVIARSGPSLLLPLAPNEVRRSSRGSAPSRRSRRGSCGRDPRAGRGNRSRRRRSRSPGTAPPRGPACRRRASVREGRRRCGRGREPALPAVRRALLQKGMLLLPPGAC